MLNYVNILKPNELNSPLSVARYGIKIDEVTKSSILVFYGEKEYEDIGY